MHGVARINGITYGFVNDKGGHIKVDNVNYDDDNNNYEWTYRAQCQRS